MSDSCSPSFKSIEEAMPIRQERATLCERILELEAEIETLKASARTAIDAGEVMIRDLRSENAALKRQLRTTQNQLEKFVEATASLMAAAKRVCPQCGAEFIPIAHEPICWSCDSQAHD